MSRRKATRDRKAAPPRQPTPRTAKAAADQGLKYAKEGDHASAYAAYMLAATLSPPAEQGAFRQLAFHQRRCLHPAG